MHPALQHFTSFLDALTDLVDGVRGNLDINRPRFAPPGVGKKLKAGIRLIEVYLRRVLLVLALKLEPTLVHNPKPLVRSKKRICLDPQPVFRVVLDQYLNRHKRAELIEMARKKRRERCYREKLPPRPVFMGHLYKRLDMLTAIAANPLKRAKAVAYRIARGREGYIMMPDRTFRPPGCVRKLWRTETDMTFNALGFDIATSSKQRPPQLPRRERGDGPRIRILDPPGPFPPWLKRVPWKIRVH